MIFKYLNNVRKNYKLKSSSGQIAIILILVIAMALIFYAVSMNLGAIAQKKTMTTIGANTGASLLASQMASYGQQLFFGQLGGKLKVCAWSGIAAAFLSFVVIIISIIAFQPEGVLLALAILGAALSAAAVTLQATVIQPGLTDLWNKTLQDILPTRDQFLEGGIRAALQVSVNDSARVPDLNDSDTDRVWGYTWIEPNDYISRFGFYYSDRLRRVTPPDVVPVQNFVDALKELIYDDPFSSATPDNFGLFDPVGCGYSCCYDMNTNPIIPSECNPCCVPLKVEDPLTGNLVDYRPPCCDNGNPPTDPDPQCGVSITCGDGSLNQSPYLDSYSFVFDPFLENPEGGSFVSFREALGRDDENRLFHRDCTSINLIEQIPGPLTEVCSQQEPGGDFYINDATGYFSGDDKHGIFSFFYKAADWGIDLNSLNISDHFGEHCFWYDVNREPSCGPVALPFELRGIKSSYFPLPNDPADLSDPTNVVYNTEPFVDGTGSNVPGNPPLAVDKITFPTNILSAANQCAQYVFYPLVKANNGFWKKGGDRFCAQPAPPDQWPYFGICPAKFGLCKEDDGLGGEIDRPCACGEPGATPPGAPDPYWPDDPLDDVIYGMPEFFDWAITTIFPIPANDLTNNFDQWYPEAALWIEPGTENDSVAALRGGVARPGIDCYSCNKRSGTLWIWLVELIQVRDRLQKWLENKYVGDTCEEVWCVPDDTCPLVKADEKATFGTGTIEDVINCLEHNTTTGGGNAARFQTCYDACIAANQPLPLGTTAGFQASNIACGNGTTTFLPRSLIPGFDPSAEFIRADMTNLTPLTNCPQTCLNLFNNCDPSVTSCISGCNNTENSCNAPCYSAEATCIDGCGGNVACITTCQSQRVTCVEACGSSRKACITGCGSSNQACLDSQQCQTFFCTSATFTEDVAAEADNYKGSCIDFTVPGYMKKLAASIPEAENQVAKFNTRKEFLEILLNQLDDPTVVPANPLRDGAILDVLNEGIDRLKNFLEGPAAALIQARIAWASGGLPYSVIYGWQSEPTRGATRGLWHLVRVEGRIPGKCDNACNENQTADTEWPRVITKNTSWGLRRCYELTNTEGAVKMRVTRWDENRLSNAPILFPNGMPIWSFRSHPSRHPNNDGSEFSNNPFLCPPISDPGNIYEGAFILNSASLDGATYNNCRNKANDLLDNYGVATQTCARYYFHEGRTSGLGFQFVPCNNF